MSRLYQPLPAYAVLRDRVAKLIRELVDRFDPDALVHVGTSAMGLLHVIVVSDRLASEETPAAEDRLWADLEVVLPESALDRITVWQVLSVREALRLRGPADVPMLRAAGEQLLQQLERREKSRGGSEALDRETDKQLLVDLENWAETAALARLSNRGADLARMARSARDAHDRGMESPTKHVVGQLEDHLRSALEEITTQGAVEVLAALS
jgi:hypothetical protein